MGTYYTNSKKIQQPASSNSKERAIRMDDLDDGRELSLCTVQRKSAAFYRVTTTRDSRRFPSSRCCSMLSFAASASKSGGAVFRVVLQKLEAPGRSGHLSPAPYSCRCVGVSCPDLPGRKTSLGRRQDPTNDGNSKSKPAANETTFCFADRGTHVQYSSS